MPQQLKKNHKKPKRRKLKKQPSLKKKKRLLRPSPDRLLNSLKWILTLKTLTLMLEMRNSSKSPMSTRKKTIRTIIPKTVSSTAFPPPLLRRMDLETEEFRSKLTEILSALII